jgi:hypothetical protein
MIPPALVNPWFSLGGEPTDAPVEAPRYSEATAGYPCCYNCGHREPCDQWCPRHLLDNQEPLGTEVARAIADRWELYERDGVESGPPAAVASFSLDEYAFMAEIEPVPEFLTANMVHLPGDDARCAPMDGLLCRRDYPGDSACSRYGGQSECLHDRRAEAERQPEFIRRAVG